MVAQSRNLCQNEDTRQAPSTAASTIAMKTHPIEAAIGLALIVCWAVATLAMSALALLRHLQRTSPAIQRPAPEPSPLAPTDPPPLVVEVLQLQQAGLSQRAIAQHLGVNRSRVRRLLLAAADVPVAGFPRVAAL